MAAVGEQDGDCMPTSCRKYHDPEIRFPFQLKRWGLGFVSSCSICHYLVYISNKIKKEDQLKFGKFLEDYKALKPVIVKILNSVKGNGNEFINEVQTIDRIHHINVVRLVGYYADGFRRALLYEFLPNNSLEKFIGSDQQKRSLGWETLQDIALDIAKGIEYLHLGCDQ
ncbi:hypothetical protein TEA_004052 [Camellia sinensis var. sinensis]|uniref:Protein kinase domain-containing protein n=1 Tax=Camellia sinensis var. sinensis TaxID=542762 RepID=A0A4S4DAP9_CAMSN|nr:hypothetical protein TEA_004052 [Camellia sinensis var. sinensis]